MLGGDAFRQPQMQKEDDEKKKRFDGWTRRGARDRALMHDLFYLCVDICIKGQCFTVYLYI